MYIEFDIPTRIRELRKAAGFTQEEFSEYSQMSYKFYQHVESGRKKLIRIDTIERICKAYDIALYEFFAQKLPRTNIRANKKIFSSPHNSKSENKNIGGRK